MSKRRRRFESLGGLAAAGVIGLLLIPLAVSGALAQQNLIVTAPVGGTTQGGNASGTIGSSAWQRVWPTALSIRRGCMIQNNGTHTMWVTEGLGVAASTTALAVQLQPGVPYYCGNGGSVLQGEIDISGTTGDAFYAGQN